MSGWDCFGDDSEENETGEMISPVSDDVLLSDKLFIELMKASPLRRECNLRVCPEASDAGPYAALLQRLSAGGFSQVNTETPSPSSEMFDIIINLQCLTVGASLGTVGGDAAPALLPGGLLVAMVPSHLLNNVSSTEGNTEDSATDTLSVSLPSDTWVISGAGVVRVEGVGVEGGVSILCVRKRAVGCNLLAAPWAQHTSAAALAHERSLLEEITVGRSSTERASGTLSASSHAAALHALREHGVAVLKGMFPAQGVLEWGERAMEDFKDALGELEKRGVDIMHPGTGRDMCFNYQELAMREDLRVDLRNGSRMAAAAREGLCLPYTDQPAVRRLVQDACASPPGEHRAGNFGRWNFGGGGPTQELRLAANDIGCVLSLPGSADQAVHADTAHLVDHVQLAAHYVDMFLPALQGAEATHDNVGQTAFIVGTHKLDVCARVMRDEEDAAAANSSSSSSSSSGGDGGVKAARAERYRRLVRPQLEAGDALLFDCRCLHFGLANRSAPVGAKEGEGVWRPQLYVNFFYPWFVDPKNWDNEKLFPDTTPSGKKK